MVKFQWISCAKFDIQKRYLQSDRDRERAKKSNSQKKKSYLDRREEIKMAVLLFYFLSQTHNRELWRFTLRDPQSKGILHIAAAR